LANRTPWNIYRLPWGRISQSTIRLFPTAQRDARMLPPYIEDFLELERCPHCSVHKPFLMQQASFETTPEDGDWIWGVYVCQGCHFPVVAGGPKRRDRTATRARLIVPKPSGIDEAVPEPARRYLQQASEALHTPDGATMLAASAVDALLKPRNSPRARSTRGSNRPPHSM
jgi:hypothetical protein